MPPIYEGTKRVIARYIGSRPVITAMANGKSSFAGALPTVGRTMLASLKSSLILDEGTGGPTWSRATKAWRFNELGYLEELASGCVAFGGARLVRNTVRTTSENFNNASWPKTGTITTPSANVIVCANSTSSQYIGQPAVSPPPTTIGQVFIYGARVQYIPGGVPALQLVASSLGFGTGQFAAIDLTDGSVSTTGCSATATLVASNTYDFSIRVTATAAHSTGDAFSIALADSKASSRLGNFTGDGIKSVGLLRAWAVDVTGYDASYVPEYVSVGSDTGKNFLLHTDDFSQSAWNKTNVTITQSAIANPVNGLINAQKVEATSSAATGLYQAVTGAGSSSGMTFVVYAKKGSGATDMNVFYLRNHTTATNIIGVSINYDTGVITYLDGSSGVTADDAGNGWWKISLISATGFSTGDEIIVFIGTSGSPETAGESLYIYRPYLGRGVTAPATLPAVAGAWDPFGSGSDGAKYFETDWQGAPLPAASLLGFRRGAAATNNLLWSRDLRATGDGILSGNQKIWAMSPGTASVALSNGDFATNDLTGWTNSSTGTGTANASTGAAVLVGAGSSNRGAIEQALSTVSGKTYTVKFDATITSGTIASGPLNTTGQPFGWTVLSVSSTGSNIYYSFTATATTTYLKFWTSGTANGSVDNISVTESSIQATNTTGLDGIANTATTLTAAAADAIILQPITLASADRCASAYLKRRTGTGAISFTQDGGSTWTDITSQINSSTWSRVQITSTLANPSVSFKIGTSGDAIDVDCVQNEAGAVATSPIVTTTAAVTRNADSLAYQTASNIDFAVGTVYCSVKTLGVINTAEVSISASASALFYRRQGGANTSFSCYDGTNLIDATGLSDVSTGNRKRAMSYGPAGIRVSGDGLAPAAGLFVGNFGSAGSITIGGSAGGGNAINGYIGPVAIYNYQMTDAELQGITV